MRTLLFLAAAAAIFAAAPAAGATRNFGITGFERIRVEGPLRVSLATGVAPFARANGSASALDRVTIEMQGSTLVVRPSVSGWGGYPGEQAAPVEVSVGTHELSAAWLNGSGSLAIDRVGGLKFDLAVQGSGAAAIGRVEVDQLNVSVTGTASATLAGKAGKLTALVRGISALDASRLATKDAKLGVEGAATVRADVGNSVAIDASGPATVTLTGAPSCTVRMTGSASVSGCGSSQ